MKEIFYEKWKKNSKLDEPTFNFWDCMECNKNVFVLTVGKVIKKNMNLTVVLHEENLFQE